VRQRYADALSRSDWFKLKAIVLQQSSVRRDSWRGRRGASGHVRRVLEVALALGWGQKGRGLGVRRLATRL